MIWKRCLKGDREAFEELYKRYYSILYNYGMSYVKDSDMVRNCLQDLFVKLIVNHDRLSETDTVRFYLLKAFRFALYNSLKAESTRLGFVASVPDDMLVFQFDNIEMEENAPADIECLKEAIRSLSSRQQEVIYLYYVRELSHADIAKILNINSQSSKNLLARSIAKLRALILGDDKKHKC